MNVTFHGLIMKVIHVHCWKFKNTENIFKVQM